MAHVIPGYFTASKDNFELILPACWHKNFTLASMLRLHDFGLLGKLRYVPCHRIEPLDPILSVVEDALNNGPA